VHCHAGFGRTGIAIACILIFKDHVESAQVVKFIRLRRYIFVFARCSFSLAPIDYIVVFCCGFCICLRFCLCRPGSIQTSNQEKFVKQFENAHRFLLQSFPTKESVELHSSFGATVSSPTSSGSAAAAAAATSMSPGASTTTGGGGHSLYLKSIQHSLKDQQYMLTPTETTSRKFKWKHKIMYYTILSLRNLCSELIQLVYMGITGLTKLVPKENHSQRFHLTSQDSSLSRESLANAPSYMVATNSLHQSLEETLLTDIKLEINMNKWTKLLSVADVAAISLGYGSESVKRLTKVGSTVEGGGASEKGGGGGKGVSSNNLSEVVADVNEAAIRKQRAAARRGISETFRSNSFKENSEADYSKSKSVSANVMAQLMLDWLESRQNAVFDATTVHMLQEIWKKHYHDFGSKCSTCPYYCCFVLLLFWCCF
jgi:hypothetical protein